MKYRDRRALAEQELQHKLSIHAELFSFLIKLEELRDLGRADYSFRIGRSGTPVIQVSIFVSDQKASLKRWELPLPSTEQSVGTTIAALLEITARITQEEMVKKEQARQALLSKFTPEEIKLLTNTTDTNFKYEA